MQNIEVKRWDSNNMVSQLSMPASGLPKRTLVQHLKGVQLPCKHFPSLRLFLRVSRCRQRRRRVMTRCRYISTIAPLTSSLAIFRLVLAWCRVSWSLPRTYLSTHRKVLSLLRLLYSLCENSHSSNCSSNNTSRFEMPTSSSNTRFLRTDVCYFKGCWAARWHTC